MRRNGAWVPQRRFRTKCLSDSSPDCQVNSIYLERDWTSSLRVISRNAAISPSWFLRTMRLFRLHIAVTRAGDFQTGDKHMNRLRCLPLLLGGVKSLTGSSRRVYHSTSSDLTVT